jgi:hypothetical protein
MGTAVAERPPREIAFRSIDELREVGDRLMAIVDADERIGPMFRATRSRTRFEYTDYDLALNVASRLDDPDHCIDWNFDDEPPWHPRITLRMSSGVANAYLQGRESLPVAIARRKVAIECESRAALLFLPLARLLVKPYRELVEADYPHLLLT